MRRDGRILAGLTVAFFLLAAAPACEAAPAHEGADTAGRPLHLRIASGDPEGPKVVEVRVEPVPQEHDEEEDLVRKVELTDGAAELDLFLPGGGRYRISTAAPGTWSRPILIDEGSSPEPTATLWPAAKLEAELELPDRKDRPEEIEIRLSPVAGLDDAAARSQPSREVELSCPLAEELSLACSVPAGRWNLRLAAAPFAPELLWGVRVDAAEGLDLGTVKLRRGGSVLGRLTTEEGPVDPRRARVELRPLRAGKPDDPTLEEELRQLDRVGEVRGDGSFQLVGVTPGLYEVRASHPGFVPLSRAPVTVEGGTVTELDEPLVLELPLRLALSVEPVTGPSGGPWSVELYRLPKPGEVRLTAQGDTDGLGFWESRPVPAGRYLVRLLDAQEAALVEQEIELDRASREARIEVPLVYVEGEVRLDDRPLAARVWFGGRTGSVSVETESDEAGELFAVLPRHGEWRVDVHADSPVVRSRGLRVDVEPIEDTGVAEVEIEIPATSLLGRVVDEHGGPPGVPAQVVLLLLDGGVPPTGIRSELTGEFEIGGLPPGVYTVTAETSDASSAPVDVRVDEGAATPVTLTLRPEGEMVGRVISESGPVPGASVRVQFVPGAGQGIGAIERRQTTGTGSFAAPLPADAVAANVLTMAPGFALDVRRVATSEEAQIVLDRSAGRLSLLGIRQAIWAQEGPTVGLLMIDGEPIDLPPILEWAQTHGGRLTEEGTLSVPWMPPGQYALCRLAMQEALLVVNRSALPAARACAEGFLAPGGELALALPPSQSD